VITACLVVRNEAGRLAECFAAIQPFVSEIIVVDTGSTDETPDMARRLGAEVYAVPFTNFAQARNAALERARGDWILVLDPDESFEPGHLRRFVEFTRRRDLLGCMIPRYDYLGQFGWSLSRPCRFYRNLPGVGYRRAVFEEPEFPAELSGQILCCWEVAIHHYGFQLPEGVLSEKRLLYGRLLQSGNNPQEEPWAFAALATLKADSGDINAALGLLEAQARSAAGRARRDFVICHAKLLFAAGRYNEAVVVIEHALPDERGTGYRESRLHNLKGLVMSRSSRPEDARDCFRQALQCCPEVAAYWVNLALAQKRLEQVSEYRLAWATAAKLNPQILRTPVANFFGYNYQQHWVHRLDTDCAAASLVGLSPSA
jgi:tetratricopeptide (TPR) repeat protein